jgi:oxygen-independent coproporphyrinogen-3 oxidase
VASEDTLGLYVHIPFCEAKCTYCHFAIDPRRPDAERQERYTRALIAEVEAAEPGPADTLYFGGGTPSLLEASRIARVVELAQRRFGLPAGAEVTVEPTPATSMPKVTPGSRSWGLRA